MPFLNIKCLQPYAPSIALAVLGLLAVGIAQLKPPQTGTVIALFDPRMSDYDVITHVNNTTDFLMTKGPTANSYVIRSDIDHLPERLKSSGAWLVLNYLGAAGCSSTLNTVPNIYTPTDIT